jgi:hypothetical protein
MVVMMFSPPAVTGRSLSHSPRSERNQRSQDQDRSHHNYSPQFDALMPPSLVVSYSARLRITECGLTVSGITTCLRVNAKRPTGNIAPNLPRHVPLGPLGLPARDRNPVLAHSHVPSARIPFP